MSVKIGFNSENSQNLPVDQESQNFNKELIPHFSQTTVNRI